MIIRILNNLLTALKGQEYNIDPRISVIYLIRLVFRRLTMFIRGKISFVSNKGLLFIGRDTQIRAKEKIHLGRGVTIDDGAFLDALSTNGVVMGDNVSVGKNTAIECTGSLKLLGHGMLVGDNVGLGRDCFYGCAGGIRIGDDTIIGNYVSFHSENHNSTDLQIPIRLQGVNHKGIVVGNNCWLGAKATILDGAIIHDGCIIAAGCLVTAGEYLSNGIYGGVPAKLIKRRV